MKDTPKTLKDVHCRNAALGMSFDFIFGEHVYSFHCLSRPRKCTPYKHQEARLTTSRPPPYWSTTVPPDRPLATGDGKGVWD